MATTVSPNMGTHKHQWISPKKKDGPNNQTKKTLMALYPAMKSSDIEVLAQLVDSKQLRQYLRDHGQD
jgi:hypothetical protein